MPEALITSKTRLKLLLRSFPSSRKSGDSFLVGEPAKGKISPIIGLLFVGEILNKNYLFALMMKVVAVLKRKLLYIIIDIYDLMKIKNKQVLLLLREK